jgi:hypothetical protein
MRKFNGTIVAFLKTVFGWTLNAVFCEAPR